MVMTSGAITTSYVLRDDITTERERSLETRWYTHQREEEFRDQAGVYIHQKEKYLRDQASVHIRSILETRLVYTSEGEGT